MQWVESSVSVQVSYGNFIEVNESGILSHKDCSTTYKSNLYRKRNGGVIAELNLGLNKEVALGWEN